MPEYGRHIHEMVDSLMQIEDRRERNRQARAVIAVMGNLNPLLRDTADFTHKLWDHLFIMSDFQLDVDSPLSAAFAPGTYHGAPAYALFVGTYRVQALRQICRTDDPASGR